MSAKQYIIENRDHPGHWLCRVDKQRGRYANEYESQTNTYGPRIEDAIVFSRWDFAARFAKRWGGIAWRVKDGQPVEIVWPENEEKKPCAPGK